MSLQKIDQYSRLKHGRKKDFVEQEITTRIGIDLSAPPVDISKLPGQPSQGAPSGGNAMAQMLYGGANQMPPPAIKPEEVGKTSDKKPKEKTPKKAKKDKKKKKN